MFADNFWCDGFWQDYGDVIWKQVLIQGLDVVSGETVFITGNLLEV